MKYTQGENEKKLTMKFHMPVVVRVDAASEDVNDERTLIKIMVTLPIEYQLYNEGGCDEPPKPIDSEIIIEEVEEFKGFVRSVNEGVFFGKGL
jgi:hypothetical protein